MNQSRTITLQKTTQRMKARVSCGFAIKPAEYNIVVNGKVIGYINSDYSLMTDEQHIGTRTAHINLEYPEGTRSKYLGNIALKGRERTRMEMEINHILDTYEEELKTA